MKTKQLFLQILMAVFCAVVLSSCADEPRNLGVTYPDGLGIAWEYDILEADNGQMVKVGTVRNENAEFSNIGRVRGALRQRRSFSPGSIIGLPGETGVKSIHFQVGDDNVEILAENFCELFDLMLNSDQIENITAGSADGPSFQRFGDFEPGWVPFVNFTEESNNDIEIHPTTTFFLEFTNRDSVFTGTVDVFSTTRFSGFERIDTSVFGEVVAFRYRNRTFFDFNLQMNGRPISVERHIVDLITWYHPTDGVLRRERSEVAIRIASQFPIVHEPRQVWELTAIEGIETESEEVAEQ